MDKLIIFDLDGTLIDSIPDIAEQVNNTLIKFNRQPLSKEEIASYTGNGARKLIERSFGGNLDEKDLNERVNYYNDIYTNCGSPNTHVFEGIEQMIAGLKQKGYKLAILTNKPNMTTVEIYKKYLEKYNFDMVVGQSASVKCKPDKTATLSILEKLNVEKQNAYFIGDDITDVLTAKNAGIKGISVLWGYRAKDLLIEAGATVFANRPQDVLDLVD